MMKRLRIGWFTFSCCEDSTIIFTELLNTHWDDWKDKIEFIHARVLQNTNRWEPMDVAFVEGAIAHPEQEEKLKKIRSLATKLVAIGSCACSGMPGGQRNNFDGSTREEIRGLLEKFKQSATVKKLKDIVSVDAEVNGCPMNEKTFLELIDKLLIEFGVVSEDPSNKQSSE
jgi:coenzyme F420-reducing hydrogenase gamma subunit